MSTVNKVSYKDEDALQYLIDIFADFVQEEKSEPALDLLFSQKAGQWVDFQVLCNQVESLRTCFNTVHQMFEGNLLVTWLDLPQSGYGEGYCVLVLFVEELIVSKIAIYNRALFMEGRVNRNSL